MEATGEEKFVNLWPVDVRAESTDEELSPGPGPLCDTVLQLERLGLVEAIKPEAVHTSTGNISTAQMVSDITYEMYESELQMPAIMRLMKMALSEPYSIYTYRYFIHNWPQLCVLAQCGSSCVGAIVCKLEMHHYTTRRGYIAMLAVDERYRKRKIGKG